VDHPEDLAANAWTAAGISGEQRRFAMRNAALFIASQHGPAEAGLLHSILRTVGNIAKRWKSRTEVARLVDFDDHMLADIGLSRGDVREALDLPFWNDPGNSLQFRAARNRSGWKG
jgi:uncharacterized protein YjiS (DUF1127 family)